MAFCGRQGDRIMSAWRHSTVRHDIRRVVHSDLAYSPVMPGDPNRIVLCGGGIAALHALAEAARAGQPLPTVIALDVDHPAVSLDKISDDLKSWIANSVDEPSWYGMAATETLHRLVAKIRGENDPRETQPPAHEVSEPTNQNPDPTRRF